MNGLRWLWSLVLLSLLTAGCDKHPAKKPDPTKGTVTGIVLCADTGKPARFASVTLSAALKKDEKLTGGSPFPQTEQDMTDLEGHFRMEAVEPGRYYAFATQEGYLDPLKRLDFAKLQSLSSDRERNQEAVDEWKDHLVEVKVSRGRTSEISIQIERAAEIGGTVSYDDGSPAIGIPFQLLRTTEKGGKTEIGLALLGSWTSNAIESSDGHGHFKITNLSAGEYTVCALLPAESEGAAPRVCLGNTFRKKDAETVKVQAGETVTGLEIEIPLSGMQTVAGLVTALADGHGVGKGTIRLLWAGDREIARELTVAADGSFSMDYVPEGKYILQITDAQDAEAADSGPAPASGAATPPASGPVQYANKEMPLTVQGNMSDVQIQLSATSPDHAAKP